ncbi:metabolite traffic protein EboE [Lewinella sp. JB7]|uniref:metabolite traffic protein EboE n=1 Tax=Lewinella sp. JB7 TaxID=2962887 RepID=UPI0020C95C80|nr:metabolite traffic protein EboE [Lewinella sp. JB7]MCP9236114.1 metabolite traffic protein EboE [Lewinella sp. JB7]
MQINPGHHLTYCTNIHPGESWPEVLASLDHLLKVKQLTEVDGPFGIGLRLSARAAEELAGTQELTSFRRWLSDHECYVFTMNGFPYGEFHGERVKDDVYTPDWTTRDRVDYTIRLFGILAELLPAGMDGGISTSPLSYRFWFTSEEELARATRVSTRHLMEVVLHLVRIKERTGKSLHLDIEPEPDGILENSQEFTDFYRKVVLTQGLDWLQRELGVPRATAEAAIREHLTLCWDVCHFAVAYESPADVLQNMREAGIRVGKLQISAALKADLTEDRAAVHAALLPYDEPTYLHQTALRHRRGNIRQFPDLGPGLAALSDPAYTELRTHFHVPIYTDCYGRLQSTNDAIAETLKLWKADPFTHHLEVETYTWDVLPDHQRLTLTDSIHRELEWVRNQLNR